MSMELLAIRGRLAFRLRTRRGQLPKLDCEKTFTELAMNAEYRMQFHVV